MDHILADGVLAISIISVRICYAGLTIQQERHSVFMLITSIPIWGNQRDAYRALLNVNPRKLLFRKFFWLDTEHFYKEALDIVQMELAKEINRLNMIQSLWKIDDVLDLTRRRGR